MVSDNIVFLSRHVPPPRLGAGGAPVLGVVPQVRALAARSYRALPASLQLRLARPGRLRRLHRHQTHRALQGIYILTSVGGNPYR